MRKHNLLPEKICTAPRRNCKSINSCHIQWKSATAGLSKKYYNVTFNWLGKKWWRTVERRQLLIHTCWKTRVLDHSPHPRTQSDRLLWRWGVHWRPRRTKRPVQGHWPPDRVTRCSRPQLSPCLWAPGGFWLDLVWNEKHTHAHTL